MKKALTLSPHDKSFLVALALLVEMIDRGRVVDLGLGRPDGLLGGGIGISTRGTVFLDAAADFASSLRAGPSSGACDNAGIVAVLRGSGVG